jgi:hypothetical protein
MRQSAKDEDDDDEDLAKLQHVFRTWFLRPKNLKNLSRAQPHLIFERWIKEQGPLFAWKEGRTVWERQLHAE